MRKEEDDKTAFSLIELANNVRLRKNYN